MGCISRREADEYIASGLVRVNGIVVTTLSNKYDPTTTHIEVLDGVDGVGVGPSSSSSSSSSSENTSTFQHSGNTPVGGRHHPMLVQQQLNHHWINPRNNKTTVILHKPLGIVSCQPDTIHHKPAIQLLTRHNQYHIGTSNNNSSRRHHQESSSTPLMCNNNSYEHDLSTNHPNRNHSRSHSSRGTVVDVVEPYQLSKLAVAGRLDINSTGLLLFTQCGYLASQIIGPTSTVEKEYLVRINNNHNHNICDDNHNDDALVLERIEQLRHGIQCSGDFLEAVSIDRLVHSTSTLTNHPQSSLLLRIVLHRGKKHHIRRMISFVGWNVQSLKRVRIGNIMLGSLPKGQWRYLDRHETTMGIY